MRGGGIPSSFVYLFHVGVFFVASGYTYSGISTLKDYKTFFIKKVKRLYVPYVFYNLILLLLNNVFVLIKWYPNDAHITNYLPHIIKIFLLVENAELLGAAWFLRVLFLMSVGYGLIQLIISKLFRSESLRTAVHGIIAVVFYSIGYAIQKMGLNSNAMLKYLSLIMIAFVFYHIGFVIKKHLKTKDKNSTVVLIPIIFCFLIILFSIFGSATIGNDTIFYGHIVVTTMLGWFLLWGLSGVIHKSNVLTKAFDYISKQSIYILLFHFIGFKLATCALVYIRGDSITLLEKFPTAYDDCWVIYTLVGFVFSIVAGAAISYIKSKLASVRYTSKA